MVVGQANIGKTSLVRCLGKAWYRVKEEDDVYDLLKNWDKERDTSSESIREESMYASQPLVIFFFCYPGCSFFRSFT